MRLLVGLVALAGWALASLRWLRVAQREHYLPGSASRFALRWWQRPPNPALAAAALVGALAGIAWPAAGLVTALVVAAGPVGLGLRGRTRPLQWTPRLSRLAAILATLEAVALVGGLVAGAQPQVAVWSSLCAPLLADAAMVLTAPLEARLSDVFVRRAAQKLRSTAPHVVAITGSYGKTSTKEHTRDLLSGTFEVVASPGSFNNRLGLARTINEQLAPGTEVFVAEMGTYAKGEIADLCSWIKPTVSVLTAIGPVHLERFGSLQAIAEAKAEIVDGAETLVVNADNPLVAEVGESVTRAGPRAGDDSSRRVRLVRCSTADPTADVVARRDGTITVWVRGEQVGEAPADLFPINVACAVGACLALGVPLETLRTRLPGLAASAHRQTVTRADRGITVVDDTYNANPAGALEALARLAQLGTAATRHRVVVTPGMVELGQQQYEENVAFAEHAAKVATDLVIVGTTNRRALVTGARAGGAAVTLVPTREQAVAWVREHVHPGDVVLYENDLPDHYP